MARIALLFHSYQVGGIARSNIRLAREFLRRGHQVDLLVGTQKGELREEKPAEAREFVLRRGGRWATSIAAALQAKGTWSGRLSVARSLARSSGKTLYRDSIAEYLLQNRPDALFARTAPLIVSAVLARQRAGVSTFLVGSEHNRLQTNPGQTPPEWRYNIEPAALRHFYRQCDALVAVSDGVGEEMAASCGLGADEVLTIYNPVVDEALEALAAAPPPHPWLESKDVPVIVSVGKLNPQKDHQTLFRAFAELRKRQNARLIVVGGTRADAGSQAYAKELQGLVEELGIKNDVDLVGHQSNPFAYMKHASLFVLSSAWEGLGNVLIEALACGCPVVSTDCVSGPREILEGGKYGRLVAVSDPSALAQAMVASLEVPLLPEVLMRRAQDFAVDRVADRTLSIARLN